MVGEERNRRGVLGTLVVVAFAAPTAGFNCVYDGVDYSPLAKSGADYAVDSEVYYGFEFIFNMCRSQLVWSDAKCYAGAGMCERMKGTGEGSDIYGFTAEAEWHTDKTGDHYVQMGGPECIFGGSLSTRIYQKCLLEGTTPTAHIVHESYYECKVYVELHSLQACTKGERPMQQKTKTGLGIGGAFILGLVGLGLYFGIGTARRSNQGETGMDRMPHREFWSSIPGLVKDGVSFTAMHSKSGVKSVAARVGSGSGEKASLMSSNPAYSA